MNGGRRKIKGPATSAKEVGLEKPAEKALCYRARAFQLVYQKMSSHSSHPGIAMVQAL
jgi:hypothetical protein